MLHELHPTITCVLCCRYGAALNVGDRAAVQVVGCSMDRNWASYGGEQELTDICIVDLASYSGLHAGSISSQGCGTA